MPHPRLQTVARDQPVPDLSRGGFLRLGALGIAALATQGLGAVSAPPSILVRKRSYSSLPSLASQLGLKLAVSGSSTRLTGNSISLEFAKDNALVQINGQGVWLTSPMMEQTGQLYLPASEITNSLLPILLPQRFSPVPRFAHVVIDPGHGGKDPGVVNTTKGLQEKALTLDVSLRLRSLLQKRGIKVTMTRSTDVFLDLEDRPAIANQVKADFFVSVHFNASSAAVRGQETFILTPSGDYSFGATTGSTATLPGNRQNTWNSLAAYLTQRDIVARQPEADDRGVKRARFKVLTTLNCPGILVEGAFVSSAKDASLLATPAYRQSLAVALDQGFARYSSILGNIRAGAVKR